MGARPNMAVVPPGDPIEARLATRAVVALEGPASLRLGKAGEPAVHVDEPGFTLGRAITMREGSDLTLIASGSMLATADRVAAQLADKGLSVRLLSMHTIKPLDREAVDRKSVV